MIRITISFIAIAIFIARRKVLEFFSISFSLEAMPMLIGIFAAIFFTILTIVIQRIIEMSQSNRTLTYGLDEIGGNRPTWIEKWVDIHLMRVEEKPKPLLKAVKEGKTAEVHHLLREGYSADASNVEETPLMLAAEGGHTDVILTLISNGADVNAKNPRNLRTPLHYASVLGNTSTVEALILHNADVDAREELERTPLHFASFWDHAETVGMLLKHGADAELHNRAGFTPLMLASISCNTMVVHRLLDHGVDVNARNSTNMTDKIKIAIDSTSGFSQAIQGKFLNAGWKFSKAMLRPLVHPGWTALMYASDKGCIDVVHLLLKHGADVNCTTSDDETSALILARNGNHEDVVRALLEAGAVR